jgi:Flp pilus assembly protein TadD
MRVSAPHDAAVLLEPGKCHLVSGRFDAAQAAFEAAVKADGKSWEAESMLGVALDYEEHSAEALVHHDRAVMLAPDNAVALSNKGLSLALGGHLDQALAVTRQAAVHPGAPARVRANLALLEAVAGNGDVAAMIARQESDPDRETIRLLQRIAAAAKK